LLGSGSHEVADFIEWFADCDPNNGHINANGILCCASFAYLSSDHETGWYAVDKMKFLDDNGNQILAEGKFTFLPVK